MIEGILKKLNLTKNDDIDKENYAKYLENQINDVEWKKVMVDALVRSYKEITEIRLADILKRSKFIKKECNAQYEATSSLMKIFAFQVRSKI